MKKLLSSPASNPKIAKNMKQGVMTAPLHLAPYNVSGFQVCPMASKGCAAACLNTAGRGAFDKTQQARIRKTLEYFNQREDFMSQLCKEIASLEVKARSNDMKPAIRLNATSDIPWESVRVEFKGKLFKNVFEAFPDVSFYDYTAIWKRAKTTKDISNYHLTFSLKEDNDVNAAKALLSGMNVAMVFRTEEFPDTYTIGGVTSNVIDGDEYDYRPLDGTFTQGVIIGLKAKGKGKKDTTGFVRDN